MTGIKSFMNCCLTPVEQKIVFFFVVIGLTGMVIHFAGLQADEEIPESLNTIVSEPTMIVYDINTVTAEELQTIPGIGIVRAQAIIEYRDENRPIEVNDLIKVRGIGEKTLSQIRNFFGETVEGSDLIVKEPDEAAPSELDRAGLMNINAASLADLMRVKGIGQVRAESIIAYRTDRGRIKNIDQLLEIKGIGQKTLENIKEMFYAEDKR